MLLKLEIENFYSIRDRHVLDLHIAGTTPDDSRFLAFEDGRQKRVPAVIAIFGANASGKTSVLRALAFIEHLVTNSFGGYQVDDPLIISPFSTSDCQNQPTKIAIEFIPALATKDKNIYRYELVINYENLEGYIGKEILQKREPGSKVFRTVFTVERAESGIKAVVSSSKELGLSRHDPRKDVRSNVSLISSLAQYGHEEGNRLSKLFRESIDSNVLIKKLDLEEDTVSGLFSNDKSMLRMLKHKLRMIDVGIEDVIIDKVDGKNRALFKHSGLNGMQTLYFESQGTQGFFRLFPFIAHAMGNGASAILDEADSDLHPQLVVEIFGWFLRSTENRNKGQIITSCNSASALHKLVKEEIWMCHKDHTGATTITPLVDYKGVRRDANLYSLYMSGAFGAVPQFG